MLFFFLEEDLAFLVDDRRGATAGAATVGEFLPVATPGAATGGGFLPAMGVSWPGWVAGFFFAAGFLSVSGSIVPITSSGLPSSPSLEESLEESLLMLGECVGEGRPTANFAAEIHVAGC